MVSMSASSKQQAASSKQQAASSKQQAIVGAFCPFVKGFSVKFSKIRHIPSMDFSVGGMRLFRVRGEVS